MRVLVCGDRNWTDRELMARTLAALVLVEDKKVDTIIHGGAKGADRIAGILASLWGKEMEVYPADWRKHGKGAGPIRNRQMLKEGKPDLVLAFHDNLQMSKGTADMIRIAEAAGIEVRVISHAA